MPLLLAPLLPSELAAATPSPLPAAESPLAPALGKPGDGVSSMLEAVLMSDAWPRSLSSISRSRWAMVSYSARRRAYRQMARDSERQQQQD